MNLALYESKSMIFKKSFNILNRSFIVATSYESTTCTHNGKTFNLGDHFMDECNKCFCGVNGHVGCTQMMCIPPKDRKSSFKIGKY